MQFTYVTTTNNVTLYLNGQSYSADNTHPNFKKIMKSIKKGVRSDAKTNKLIAFFDMKKAVRSYLGGKIEVTDSGTLIYDGERIDNVLTHKILDMMDQGFDVEPMLNFLVNLRDNPSKAAQDELMLFMEANAMPLTPDGYLLAYKSVNSEYKDIHSGTFDNSIGQICEMARLSVDDDRHRTCSAGLHFAAKEYASGFGGSNCHLMVLKINPADIVAIPSDYNNQKGRCCKYEVIDEVKNDLADKNTYDGSAVSEEPETLRCPNCDADIGDDDYCDDCGWEA